MKELYEAVEKEVAMELERAAVAHGPTLNSPHEASAVIREELEEGVGSMVSTAGSFGLFWNAVKNDDTKSQRVHLKAMRQVATLAACEFIQVAAMAEKALCCYGEEEEE